MATGQLVLDNIDYDERATMRQMLLYSDSPCLSQPEVLIPRAHERFDAEGNLTDASTRTLLESFGVAMVAFVQRFRA